MNKEKVCCICGKDLNSPGNNFENVGVCCDECNENVVVPGRIIESKFASGLKPAELSENEKDIFIEYLYSLSKNMK